MDLRKYKSYRCSLTFLNIEQSDINGRSGLLKAINIFDDEESRANGIFVFKFDETDVVRSGIVKFIIQKIRKQC